MVKRAIFNSKMTNNKKRPERSVDRDIEIIKKELESSGNWPEKADELWLHLDQKDLDDPKQGDEIMFSAHVGYKVNLTKGCYHR